MLRRDSTRRLAARAIRFDMRRGNIRNTEFWLWVYWELNWRDWIQYLNPFITVQPFFFNFLIIFFFLPYYHIQQFFIFIIFKYLKTYTLLSSSVNHTGYNNFHKKTNEMGEKKKITLVSLFSHSHKNYSQFFVFTFLLSSSLRLRGYTSISIPIFTSSKSFFTLN